MVDKTTSNILEKIASILCNSNVEKNFDLCSTSFAFSIMKTEHYR